MLRHEKIAEQRRQAPRRNPAGGVLCLHPDIGDKSLAEEVGPREANIIERE